MDNDSCYVTFIMGIIAATIVYVVLSYDLYGHWECIEFKHTTVTEGYCTLQKYIHIEDRIAKEVGK